MPDSSNGSTAGTGTAVTFIVTLSNSTSPIPVPPKVTDSASPVKFAVSSDQVQNSLPEAVHAVPAVPKIGELGVRFSVVSLVPVPFAPDQTVTVGLTVLLAMSEYLNDREVIANPLARLSVLATD